MLGSHKLLIGSFVVGVASLASASAAAATLDFTAIGGPDGAAFWSGSADGVDVTVTPGPAGATWLYWDSDDGFGVRSSGTIGYEADEIEGSESLTVGFSSPVHLTEVSLTDLFIEDNNFGRGTYPEVGTATLSDGTVVPVAAATSGGNGSLTLAVDAWTSSILFEAPGYAGDKNWWGTSQQDHEFSVAGISFDTISTSVPELSGNGAFAAIGLLAAGLFIGTSRRRKI